MSHDYKKMRNVRRDTWRRLINAKDVLDAREAGRRQTQQAWVRFKMQHPLDTQERHLDSWLDAVNGQVTAVVNDGDGWYFRLEMPKDLFEIFKKSASGLLKIRAQDPFTPREKPSGPGL